MDHLKTLVGYFFIVLILVKGVSYIIANDLLSIFIVYLIAVIYSYFYVKHISLIAISAIVYFLIFILDWSSGLNFIVTEKVDSIVIGIGSSFMFVLPMGIGILLYYFIKSIRKLVG